MFFCGVWVNMGFKCCIDIDSQRMACFLFDEILIFVFWMKVLSYSAEKCPPSRPIPGEKVRGFRF